MSSESPILNSPYVEPKLHYATDPDGSLNYNDIRENRRIFTPDIQVMPSKQGPQGSMFEVNDFSEYGTHIIGVPFKMFKGGKSEPPPPPVDLTHIAAMPERQAKMEIAFPNVVGYRIENYDDEGSPDFQKFNKLKTIVTEWYSSKVILLNIDDQQFKRLLFFEDPKKVVDHISRGINPHINTSEHIRPVFNYYNKFSSTKYVNGILLKLPTIYATLKTSFSKKFKIFKHDH